MIQCLKSPVKDDGSNLVWILVGCGLGIVVIAVIAYICYRKNKSTKKTEN